MDKKFFFEYFTKPIVEDITDPVIFSQCVKFMLLRVCCYSNDVERFTEFVHASSLLFEKDWKDMFPISLMKSLDIPENVNFDNELFHFKMRSYLKMCEFEDKQGNDLWLKTFKKTNCPCKSPKCVSLEKNLLYCSTSKLVIERLPNDTFLIYKNKNNKFNPSEKCICNGPQCNRSNIQFGRHTSWSCSSNNSIITVGFRD